MALSDKNIVITPNTGSASDPKIVFTGADASTGPQAVTLNVYPQNGGTVSLEGSAGQLLSVTNSMVGTIYSVNDISGIPSIEVLDNGVVKLAQYGGNVLLGTGFDYGAKLQVSGAAQSAAATLGSAIGAGLFVTNNDPRYGIQMGVSGNGWGWIQVNRADGNATAYDLKLQTMGGNVSIGNVTPAYKLHVVGQVGFGQNVNGTAVIDAYGANAYFGCNTAVNGILIDSSGNMTTKGITYMNANNGVESLNVAGIRGCNNSAQQVNLYNCLSVGGASGWNAFVTAPNQGIYAVGDIKSGGTMYATQFLCSTNNAYGIFSTSARFDTVDSGTAGDALELCYSLGTGVIIGSGGVGSKPLGASVITATSRFVGATNAGSGGGFGFDSDTGMCSTGDGNLKFYSNNVYCGGPGVGVNSWDINITGTVGGYTALNANNFTGYAVAVQYNTSLNTDSRNSRGVTRLYRTDSDSDYSVQTYWTGSYWILKGYSGDAYHAGCQVAYADSAGTTATSTSSSYITGPAHTNGTDGWFRSNGDAGWYSESYAVGIYATGAGLVKTYNSANFQAVNLYATGTVTSSYSDGRLKENVKTINNALSTVLSFRGVTFNANPLAISLGSDMSTREQVGVIAQEVQVNAPQVVVPAPFDLERDKDGNEYSKSGENYLTVQYDHLTPFLIEAIREQQQQLDEQAKLIQSLKELVDGRL